MRYAAALLVATLAIPAGAARAQSDTQATQGAEQFVAAVRELDARDPASRVEFERLVKQFVPARGPLGSFLSFMAASGFECPDPHSLAPEVTREYPSYTCSRDFGDEPSFWNSYIKEQAIFGVTANCDPERQILDLEVDVTYGLTGL